MLYGRDKILRIFSPQDASYLHILRHIYHGSYTNDNFIDAFYGVGERRDQRRTVFLYLILESVIICVSNHRSHDPEPRWTLKWEDVRLIERMRHNVLIYCSEIHSHRLDFDNENQSDNAYKKLMEVYSAVNL